MQNFSKNPKIKGKEAVEQGTKIIADLFNQRNTPASAIETLGSKAIGLAGGNKFIETGISGSFPAFILKTIDDFAKNSTKGSSKNQGLFNTFFNTILDPLVTDRTEATVDSAKAVADTLDTQATIDTINKVREGGGGEAFNKAIKPIQARIFQFQDILDNQAGELSDSDKSVLNAAITSLKTIIEQTAPVELSEAFNRIGITINNEATQLSDAFSKAVEAAKSFDVAISNSARLASGQGGVGVRSISGPNALRNARTSGASSFRAAFGQIQNLVGDANFGREILGFQRVRAELPEFLKQVAQDPSILGGKEENFSANLSNAIIKKFGLFGAGASSVEEGVLSLGGDRKRDFTEFLKQVRLDPQQAAENIGGELISGQNKKFEEFVARAADELNNFAQQLQNASQIELGIAQSRRNLNAKQISLVQRSVDFGSAPRSLLERTVNAASTLPGLDLLKRGGFGGDPGDFKGIADAIIGKNAELSAIKDSLNEDDLRRAAKLNKEIAFLGEALRVAADDTQKMVFLEQELSRTRERATANQTRDAALANLGITGTAQDQAGFQAAIRQFQQILSNPQGLQQFVQSGGNLQGVQQALGLFGEGKIPPLGRQAIRGKGIQNINPQQLLVQSLLGPEFLSAERVKELGVRGARGKQLRGRQASSLPGVLGFNDPLRFVGFKGALNPQADAVKRLLEERIKRLGVDPDQFKNNFKGITGENALQFKTAFERLNQADALKKGTPEQRVQAQVLEKQAAAAFRQALGLEGSNDKTKNLQQQILDEQRKQLDAATQLVKVQETELGNLNKILEDKLQKMLNSLQDQFKNIGKGPEVDGPNKNNPTSPQDIQLSTNSNIRVDVVGLAEVPERIADKTRDIARWQVWQALKQYDNTVQIPADVRAT